MTFVYIHTNQSTIIFKALFATTGRLTVSYNASSMWSTVNTIACVFTKEINTLPIIRTVGVMKTINFLTTILSIIRISGIKSNIRTFAQNFMIRNSAKRVWSARVYVTRIHAFRDSILIATTRGVFGTVGITSRTLSWVLTACEAIADLAFRTHTSITTRNIITDTSFVTRLS
jgi:hypothetical protein